MSAACLGMWQGQLTAPVLCIVLCWLQQRSVWILACFGCPHARQRKHSCPMLLLLPAAVWLPQFSGALITRRWQTRACCVSCGSLRLGHRAAGAEAPAAAPTACDPCQPCALSMRGAYPCTTSSAPDCESVVGHMHCVAPRECVQPDCAVCQHTVHKRANRGDSWEEVCAASWVPCNMHAWARESHWRLRPVMAPVLCG